VQQWQHGSTHAGSDCGSDTPMGASTGSVLDSGNRQQYIQVGQIGCKLRSGCGCRMLAVVILRSATACEDTQLCPAMSCKSDECSCCWGTVCGSERQQ
jgi:hypothetical protein